ncbi:MAG: hypothetical protein OXI81_18045 [Paracoccaceae bacterium]|nr:hypothetical protein [Paracoccaceae bacterium]
MGDPGEDAADADAVLVHDLLDAKLPPSPLFDCGAAVATWPRQVADGLWQDEAWAPEAELTDARQPEAVCDVGLPAVDRLGVLGIDDFDVDPRGGGIPNIHAIEFQGILQGQTPADE